MGSDVRDREEHLAWCKQRALEFLDKGYPASAVASMVSDLDKHDATKVSNPYLLMLGMHVANHHDVAGVRHWIEGFR